jgi:DNA-binding NarL/FixJ family response regulator
MQLNKSVSILEDETVFQELLVDLIEDAGMSVRHRCSTARDFVMSVTATPPELAVVDLHLEARAGQSAPSGLDVLTELHSRLPSLKTVVLSASQDPATVRRCFDLGASAFVCKYDAGRADVLGALEAAARGERLFPAMTMPFRQTAPMNPANPELDQLTPKEHSVLRFVTSGVDNSVIASHLKITERTVKAHLANLYRKLHCDNRTQLALRARELGVSPQRE